VVPDRSFLALQRRFAERWAALAGIPDESAYLECTTWYRQVCGLGRDFDAHDATWRALLAALGAAVDPDAVLHAWAVDHERPMDHGPVIDFVWSPDDRTVRLNFLGERSGDGSPLAARHVGERRREVAGVVRRATADHPDAEWLRGRSWLYNLEAYRRLFPEVFLAGLAPSEPDLQFLATWGQFLDSRWRLKADLAAALEERIRRAVTTDDLERAFPLPVLETRARLATVRQALDAMAWGAGSSMA
jgi:hypothetical protein